MPQCGIKQPLPALIPLICRRKTRENNVTRHSQPIDHRPFQPKAQLANQQELVARYGAIAIPEVADALLHMKAEEEQQPAKQAKAA